MEIRDVKGYEGLYQVTADGQVWSIRSQQFVHLFDNGQGYLIADLSRNGNVVHKRVHRLVAEAFIPNPDNLPVINHKDEDKKNNRVENLEWCTQRDNALYSIKKRNTTNKKVPVTCVETGEFFESVAAAARFAKIDPQGIQHCLRGKQKTAGGYHWERAAAN